MSFTSKKLIMSASSGIPEWKTMSLGASFDFTCGAYGGLKFIISGINGFNVPNVLWSNDGINWNQPNANILNCSSIAYGNNQFLAVNTNSTIKWLSSDCINWISSTGTTSNVGWSDVDYGGGRFVTVRNGNIEYSATGNGWSAASAPALNYAHVKYGGNKFVAIVNSTSGVSSASSTDGITWTTATSLPSSSNWTSLTYGNGRFVVIEKILDRVGYSSDGITWSIATMPFPSLWSSVAYSGRMFVAVSNSTNRTAYSTDGITWSEGNLLPTTGGWTGIVYGGNKFVAFQSGSDQAAYSIFQ